MLLVIDVAVDASEYVYFVTGAAESRVVSAVGLVEIGSLALAPHSGLDIVEVKTVVDLDELSIDSSM